MSSLTDALRNDKEIDVACHRLPFNTKWETKFAMWLWYAFHINVSNLYIQAVFFTDLENGETNKAGLIRQKLCILAPLNYTFSKSKKNVLVVKVFEKNWKRKF